MVGWLEMYFCVPKCRLSWHKVKPIKAKKDVKEFYAQKHTWRRGKEEEIKLKNKHSMTIKSRIRLLSLHSIQRTRLLAALDSYRSKAIGVGTEGTDPPGDWFWGLVPLRPTEIGIFEINWGCRRGWARFGTSKTFIVSTD